MRHIALALFVTSALAGCASNSGVETTPTYSPARYVPQTPAPKIAKPKQFITPVRGPYLSGNQAVAYANRDATLRPSGANMRGSAWLVEAHDPTRIYQVPLAPKRVTTILLPSGERFNGAVGGDVEAFLINVAYAGPRPAVSILPRSASAKGNLQIVTTAGFYGFDLAVNRGVALNLIDIGREAQPLGEPAVAVPQPEGDYTRLSMAEPEGGPLPAWAPAEAWADSRKMVARFNGPLPELPALFAGQKGEQMVNYRSLGDGDGSIYLVTSRRVTEAELRLDGEIVRVTVDKDAIANGSATDPAQGADGWKGAEALPPTTVSPANSNVAVFVMPNGTAQTGLAGNPFGPSAPLQAIDPDRPLSEQGVTPPAKQPMANNLVRM